MSSMGTIRTLLLHQRAVMMACASMSFIVKLAHKLARRRRKGERLSLREISTALADAGHTSSNGSLFTATSVQRMLSQ